MASDSHVYITSRREQAKRDCRIRRGSDGVRLERLCQLKASLSGYRGAISRVKNRLEALMEEYPVDREAIKMGKESLEKTFTRYINCGDEYRGNLTVEDELEQQRFDIECKAVQKLKLELEYRINELLASTEIEDVAALPNLEEQEQVESKLLTSRLKEHERSIKFEYSNEDHDDLNEVDNDRVTSHASSASEFRHSNKGKQFFMDKYSCADDVSSTHATSL